MTQLVPPASNAPPAPPKVVRGGRQQRLLSEAITLEEETVPAFVRLTLVLASVLVVLFVAWAAVVPINEVAVAPGEVVPSAAVKVVQHLEGGVVAEVLVREGQLVKEDEVLVRLDPAQVRAEADQMRARYVGLLLRNERLKAFAEGREPSFTGIGDDHPEMVADQKRIFESQIQAALSGQSVLESQIQQREKELQQLQDSLVIAERHQALTAELLDMRQGLVDKGLISRVAFLETRRAKITAEGEVGRLREQIRVASDALSEARRRKENQVVTARQDALTEAGTVSAELAQVKNALVKLQDRVNRLDVRAPVTGLVQELKVRTVGEVIQSGTTLMRVVPLGDTLEAEVRINTRDVGHVKPGQHVNIKVSSYDFARYGSISGSLKVISPTTFMAEDGAAYYKGIVSLSQPYMGPGVGQYPVLPGMAVTGDIVTGNKTLLAYLLKPIFTSLQASFHER